MGQEAQVILRLTKVDAMQTQLPTGHSTACGEFQGPTTSQGRIMLLTKLIQPTSAATLRVPQLCPTLCDPMGCSLPGFSVHGILQARILEWVTVSFSRGSSRPRDPALEADTLTSEPPEKPPYIELAAAAKLLQSCPTLFNPIDGSSPSSPILVC